MKAAAWRTSLLPLLLLVGAMASFQLGAALAKSLFPAVGAAGAAALRLGIAALVLLVAFRVWRQPLARSAWPHVIRYGAALGAMNLCFYLSLRTLPLGAAVALEFTGPLAVAIWHSRRASDFLWVGLAVAGLIVLLPTGATGLRLDPAGVAFALGAALGWALYIVWGRQAGIAAGPRSVALGMTVGALIVLPLGAGAALPALGSATLLGIALAVALMSSVVPYVLEMWALTRIAPRVFGVSMSLEPAIAAATGWLWLGERLASAQLLAVAAIIAASAGAALSARR